MDDFDHDIRNAFHARQLPGAPSSLVHSLDDLPHRQARPNNAFRLVLGLAATLAILLVAVVALSGGSPTPPVGSPLPSLPVVVNPSVEPSSEPSPSPTIASIPPSPSPTATAAPTPTPTAAGPTPTPAANVGPAGIIDAEHGWAVGDQRLLVTADGGASWRDVNPPAPTTGGVPANLLNVEFLDPDHGWVAVAEPFKLATDPSFGRIDVWRTTDGGLTWAKSTLPKAKINNAGDTLPPFSFDFLDLTHGFAFISGNYSHSSGDSDLYYTADGGKTWSADRPTGPGFDGVEGSAISFATADDGVIVGSTVGSGVFVTHDGGTTWAQATVSAVSSFGGDLRVFSQPVFSDAQHGLVGIRFQGDTQSVTRIYRTADGGSSWSYVSAVPGSGPFIVSIVDQQHWIATDGATAVHSQNAGASWTTVATQPALDGLLAIQFTSLKEGWAEWTDTLGNSHVSMTTDDGASWQELAP
ncbi:MAG TPA: YCF48-related protein [Candidatus Limnocylindrales bacterium]|nr:YCF48-related protein [Candidatus Limnocylindrales bacterium]